MVFAGLICTPLFAQTAGPPQSQPQPVTQAAASPLPPVPDGSSILGLLDAVIGWYRAGSPEQAAVDAPSEVLFALQDRSTAVDIVRLAFRYARAEAAAYLSLGASTAKIHPTRAAAPNDILSNPELLEARHQAVRVEVAGLQAKISQLRKQIAASPRRKRAPLVNDLTVAQNQLDLATARAQFFDTISEFTAGEGAHAGNPSGTLLGQIDELERTVPQAITNEKNGASSPLAAPTGGAVIGVGEPSGLVPRAKAWIDLRSKIGFLSRRIQSTNQVNRDVGRAANAVRANIIGLDSQARALVGDAEPGASTEMIEARGKAFQAVLARHKLVGAALLPLRELSVLTSRYQDNLTQWRDAVSERAARELYGFLINTCGLAIVLGFLLSAGVAWHRIAFRYVEDARRRSQMLQLRNVVVGSLMVIVIAFEFVSEAGSLATIIGLGTAGVAVALQDVILSIAGYFRIGGRFGIRVGDWVELQGVRGEVIDIGATKLTMMELGGEGREREPTGRLLVMPNSVVFREKFANRAYGTSLGWDELELTVSPDCDYQLAEKRLLETVEEVFSRYRDAARSGAREMERRFHLRLESPRPQSRLRLGSDAIRLSVRYPVDVRARIQVMDEISRRLLEAIKREPAIRLVPVVPGAILRGEVQCSPSPGAPAGPEASVATFKKT